MAFSGLGLYVDGGLGTIFGVEVDHAEDSFGLGHNGFMETGDRLPVFLARDERAEILSRHKEGAQNGCKYLPVTA
jgi:hypothetical protein